MGFNFFLLVKYLINWISVLSKSKSWNEQGSNHGGAWVLHPWPMTMMDCKTFLKEKNVHAPSRREIIITFDFLV